ncbi:uncharacterized protein B0H18DRAFT_963473 [Fomitopsis serialis]|uniref:uncharacterized protein n=1 Tax=Fomitopsis serialis TaxID=139415 RepID=UPI002008D540|nr:uncharacterized protein B0H18DRAFT_963473 [Neoantrodia serialis]KAH9910349.1 hypothetical protein B0H18DRAFT_963473 [Neoantrodia serialis]
MNRHMAGYARDMNEAEAEGEGAQSEDEGMQANQSGRWSVLSHQDGSQDQDQDEDEDEEEEEEEEQQQQQQQPQSQEAVVEEEEEEEEEEEQQQQQQQQQEEEHLETMLKHAPAQHSEADENESMLWEGVPSVHAEDYGDLHHMDVDDEYAPPPAETEEVQSSDGLMILDAPHSPPPPKQGQKRPLSTPQVSPRRAHAAKRPKAGKEQERLTDEAQMMAGHIVQYVNKGLGLTNETDEKVEECRLKLLKFVGIVANDVGGPTSSPLARVANARMRLFHCRTVMHAIVFLLEVDMFGLARQLNSNFVTGNLLQERALGRVLRAVLRRAYDWALEYNKWLVSEDVLALIAHAHTEEEDEVPFPAIYALFGGWPPLVTEDNRRWCPMTTMNARELLVKYFGKGDSSFFSKDPNTYLVPKAEIHARGGNKLDFWRVMYGLAHIADVQRLWTIIVPGIVGGFTHCTPYPAIYLTRARSTDDEGGGGKVQLPQILDIRELVLRYREAFIIPSLSHPEGSHPQNLLSASGDWSPPHASQIGSDTYVTGYERVSLIQYTDEVDFWMVQKSADKPQMQEPAVGLVMGTSDYGDWAMRQMIHCKILRIQIEEVVFRVHDHNMFTGKALSSSYSNISSDALTVLGARCARFSRMEKKYAEIAAKTVVDIAQAHDEEFGRTSSPPPTSDPALKTTANTSKPHRGAPATGAQARKPPKTGSGTSGSTSGSTASSQRGGNHGSSKSVTPAGPSKMKKSGGASGSGSGGASGSSSSRAKPPLKGPMTRSAAMKSKAPPPPPPPPVPSISVDDTMAGVGGAELLFLSLNVVMLSRHAPSAYRQYLERCRFESRDTFDGCSTLAGWYPSATGTDSGIVTAANTQCTFNSRRPGRRPAQFGSVASDQNVIDEQAASDGEDSDYSGIVVDPDPGPDIDPHEVLLHLVAKGDGSEADLSSTVVGHVGPFSLDALPNSMLADGKEVSQDEVRKNINMHHARATKERGEGWAESKWNERFRVTVPVSQLRKYCERDDAQSRRIATGFLKKRTTVKVDDEYMIPASHPALIWRMDRHYIDFMLCVPWRMGMSVCLPPVLNHHNYSATLLLNQGYRKLHDKHGKFGCDLSGRSALLGHYLEDELWAVFVPVSFFDNEDAEEDSESPLPLSSYGIKKGDTRLTAEHFKIWQLFVCRLLEDVGWGGLVVNPRYLWGRGDNLRDWELQEICNVFEHPSIKVNLKNVIDMHNKFEDKWTKFVEEMPDAWKADKFFTHHKPVVCSSRYGQNTPVAVPTALLREATHWEESRTWADMKYVSMAIASELDVHQIDSFDLISTEEMFEKHGPVYEHYIQGPGNKPLDLDTFPIEDDNGVEIRLYTKAGHLVSRKQPDAASVIGSGCGLLFDLRRIHEMFNTFNDDGEGVERLWQEEQRQRRDKRRAQAAAAEVEPVEEPLVEDDAPAPVLNWGDDDLTNVRLSDSPPASPIWDPYADHVSSAGESVPPSELDDTKDDIEDDDLEAIDEDRLGQGSGEGVAPNDGDDDEEDQDQWQDEDEDEDEDADAFAERMNGMMGERRDQSKRLRLDLYPQAFLGHIGNFQANKLFPHYTPFMVDIDKAIRASVPDRPDFHEELLDGAEYVEPNVQERINWENEHGLSGPIIEMREMQGYNAFSHHSRPTAGQQNMTSGSLTQAATGAWAPGVRPDKLHQNILKRNELGLPHVRFLDVVTGPFDSSVSLRIECNLTVYVRRMPAVSRTGAQLYKNVALKFIEATTNPIIISRLKKHIVVFAEGVFPKIYHWTSYPVHALTSQMYRAMEPDIKAKKKVDPVRVELLSFMERSLAYAHTGNVRVISGCMKYFWLLRSMLEYGFPSIHPDVCIDTEDEFPLSIPISLWPCTEPNMTPQTVSSRAMELTWGPGPVAAYLATFTLAVMEVQGVAPKYIQHANDPIFAKALMITDMAVQLLITDLKQFVSREVRAQAKRVSSAALAQMSAQERHHHDQRELCLVQWLDCPNPFSHNRKRVDPGKPVLSTAITVPFSLLVRVLAPKSTDIINGLPKQEGGFATTHMAQRTLAELIFECTREVDPRPLHAPLVRQGSALLVLPLAMARVTTMAPSTAITLQERESWAMDVLAVSLKQNEIMFVPWAKSHVVDKNGKFRGTGPRKTVIDSWIMVDHPAKAPPLLTDAPGSTTVAHGSRSMAQQFEDQANANALRAQEQNPSATWPATDRPLHEMGWFVERSVHPEEFTLHTANVHPPPPPKNPDEEAKPEKAVMYNTYVWVLANFDFSNDVHHLALIVAVVYSRLCPTFSYPKKGDNFEFSDKANDYRALTEEIRASKWLDMPQTHGTHATKPKLYILGVTAYIIGLWDQRSPIHIYLSTVKSKSLTSIILSRHNMRGILLHNLPRLGLAWVYSTKGTKGLMDVDWGFKSNDLLRKLRLELVERFLDPPYGAYDAVVLLCGVDCANRLAVAGELVPRVDILYQPRAPAVAGPSTLLPSSSQMMQAYRSPTPPDDQSRSPSPVITTVDRVARDEAVSGSSAASTSQLATKRKASVPSRKSSGAASRVRAPAPDPVFRQFMPIPKRSRQQFEGQGMLGRQSAAPAPALAPAALAPAADVKERPLKRQRR